jgi:hypothetical protein
LSYNIPTLSTIYATRIMVDHLCIGTIGIGPFSPVKIRYRKTAGDSTNDPRTVVDADESRTLPAE